MTAKGKTNKGNDVANQSISKMSEHGGTKFYTMLFFILSQKTFLSFE